MKQFDRQNLKALREEVDTALAAIAKKHGIELKMGRVSFEASSFKGSLEGKIMSADGVTEDLKQWCKTYGLDYTKVGPQGHKLVGFRPKAYAKPWLITGPQGGSYVCSHETAKRWFGAVGGPNYSAKEREEAAQAAAFEQGDDMGFEEAPR